MTHVVWCTGAGKGIGRAVALAYAKRGATVAASARTAADLESLRWQAEELPGEIVPFPVDVTREEDVETCVANIEKECGPINLAILNAGTHIPVDGTKLSSEPFRTLLDVNVMGVVNGLVALVPRFTARHSGHIGVVSSVAGYTGLPTASAYGASKAALINMCEALYLELGAHGVQVTLINPGFVRTPLTDKNDFPMPFLMEADDAARCIVRGMDSGRFEVTFPRRLSWSLKVLRCLPYPLYFWIMKKRLYRDGKK